MKPEEPKTLIDVFMPNDLCAKCDEAEPLREYSVLLEPSPSSTRGFTPTRISFCSEFCKSEFVRTFDAVRSLDPDLLRS